MSISSADWDSYAKMSLNATIRGYYFFSVWRNYLLLLLGLKIPQGTLLEIGSSTGQNSLRLAKKYRLHPTLVDTSKLALGFAKQLFKQVNITPTLICKDVLNLSLARKFDFVHSHGLLEHFKPRALKITFHNHVKHVQSGGWIVCWVPTPDIPYLLNRWYLIKTGQWIFGYEKPLTYSEFLGLFQERKLIIRRIRHMPGWLGIAAQKPGK